MKWLEFLYYKYYKFQVRVGNSDIAPFSAMLIIAATIMLYYFDFFFVFSIIFPEIAPKMSIYITFALFISIMLCLYLLLINSGKYKRIIKQHEKLSDRKDGIVALLFPLIGFVLLLGSMFLKALQNQGKI
jgi:hypothetical protein